MSDYAMRKPCPFCACLVGNIRSRSGQDCVYCATCDRWQYNAPRTETGRAVRSVSERPDLKPSRRARILELHGHRCFSCGRTPAEGIILHVDHLISVEQARQREFLDEVICSDWNLVPMCEECNLGKTDHPVSIELVYRAMVIKVAAA